MDISKIAKAPSDSSFSMIEITSLLLTIALTAHQPLSSKLVTVGDVKPGVTASAAASLARGMLYSSNE